MKTKKLRGPLKWHGGKDDLAARIVALMPPRCNNPNAAKPDDPGWLHYVEPYFGGGAVLLANDPEGISEVVNDLNMELTNFWCALQVDEAFEAFKRRVEVVPFSQREFNGAAAEPPISFDKLGGMTGRAVNFFIRCRQSLSGRMQGFSGITRTRTRGGMNGEVSAWLSCIEGLPDVHARLKRVLILDAQPALDVIRKHDGPRTLFYLDPPYLHETRATTGEYQHEMSEADHRALMEALVGLKGRFLLSGYPSALYGEYEQGCGWNRHEFDIANNAAGGKTKRRMTECVWCNF